MKRKIILFARAPRLGFGKARMSELLNEEERLELVKRLLNNTLSVIEKTNIPYSIHYIGEEKDIRSFSDCSIVKQKGDNLGERMFNALAYELKDNDSVVLMGSDLINLNSSYIEEAFFSLENNEIVIGPTEDGGYGLIGMTNPYDVFSGITYSRDDVCANTVKLAKALDKKTKLLSLLRDLDYPEDLVREEVGANEVSVLGHGEYNLNYKYDKNYVFRINIGSQLHLEDNQIVYEYQALKKLENSGVTPKVYQVEKKGKWIPKGFLTMEFLEGRPLNYDTDLDIAAYLLAKVHNQPFTNDGMILADKPFKVMYDEFITMFSVYKAWDNKDIKLENSIENLLRIAKSRGLDDEIKTPCIINTELNNRNFIIGKDKESSYIIDWEKPLIGDCEQDLAHFTVPTTTNWKTEKIMTRKEIDSFLDEYENYRSIDRILFDKYYMFNCLRGLTWCSMAKVEYESGRTLSNDETLAKINLFLSEEFINFIYKEFYEVYDEKNN